MHHVAPLVNIFFNSLALSWVLNLEKNSCGCSVNWRRDYMKYFFMAMIAVQIALLRDPQLSRVLAGPVAVATAMYLYVTISYVQSLRHTACSCTAGRQRTVMYWMALIQSALLAWSLVR
jgi:hypothetical protein